MKSKYLFLLLFSLIFVGCKQAADTATPTVVHVYDPKIPGGQIISDSTRLGTNITNFAADSSQLGKITLTWTVPPVYKTMNYQVNIYKKKATDTSFVLPDPADQYGSAFLYLRTSVVGESFVDQDYLDTSGNVVVEVEQNNSYNYWAYLQVTDSAGTVKWSSGVKVTTTSKSPDDSFKFPDPAKFWENLTWQIGNSQASADAVNTASLNPGSTSLDSPTGGIASAYSGNVMYVADTANNRVVIYTRGLAYSCDQYKVSDPALYYACTYQYTGYPLTAVNVLGQTNAAEKNTCAQHEITCASRTTQSNCESSINFNSMCSWHSDSSISNGGSCTAYERCLTRPSRVTVADNKLFISDAGNNRIVVYSTLPLKGHLRDSTGGGIQSSPVDGSPNFVIGKKSLRDSTPEYPVGRSSLKNPGGVAVQGTSLFIADTGNNRIVKIQKYMDQGTFLCNGDDDWDNLPTDPGGGNGKCKFSGLLGQRDYFQRWSFKDGDGTLSSGQLGYDGITCFNPTPTTTQCDSPYIISTGADGTLRNKMQDDRLGRYFRYPSQVVFTVDNKMLVTSNEEASVTSPLGTSQLRGRIMVWDVDPMTELPSADPLKCNAGWVGTTDPTNNFDSSNLCQATSVMGQQRGFIFFEIVPSGGKYSNITYGLDSINGISLRSINKGTTAAPIYVNSILGVDYLNNQVFYWADFVASQTSVGNPPTAKVLNPNGALNTQTGTYLPVLKGISDISVTDNNLIFICDPGNYRIYQLRAYDYETTQ
jgi:hypothetical protein